MSSLSPLGYRSPHVQSSVLGTIREILVVFPGVFTRNSEQEYKEMIGYFDNRGTTIHAFHVKDPKMKRADAIFRGEDEIQDGGSQAIYRGGGRAFNPRRKVVYREVIMQNAKVRIEPLLSGWMATGKVISLEGYLSYDRWAQDPFLVQTWNGEIVFLQSLIHKRASDFFLPLEIAEAMEDVVLIQFTRLKVEGGNFLKNTRTLFVGMDSLTDNMHQYGYSRAEAVAELRKATGEYDIEWVGFQDAVEAGPEVSSQPLFHIDLFLTPGGWAGDPRYSKELVFMGNPKLAGEILQQAGHSIGWQVAEPQGAPFRKTKERLSCEKFKVVDLPLLILEGRNYSWNNCLVEITETSKTVILPDYKTDTATYDSEGLNPVFEIIQRRVAEIYRSEGFAVEWIHAGRLFRTMVEQRGSLHCAVKVLRRAPV